jgi:uncharacterized membrane-anchored protein
MSAQKLLGIIERAIEQGVLPRGAVAPDAQTRPWPLVLMTGLGAWLAAVPLFVVMFLIFGKALENSVLTYVLGAGILAASVRSFLRADSSVFVEQLAVPSLLVGGGLFAFGFFRDLPQSAAWALDTIMILFVARLIPRNWLRVLLGALACFTFMMALAGDHRYDMAGSWTTIHIALVIWMLAIAYFGAAAPAGASARRTAALEALSAGWLLQALFSLAIASGMTFLAGAPMERWGGQGHAAAMTGLSLHQATSLVMAVAGAAWMMFRWPALRTPWLIGAGAILAALCWLIPTLGAAFLILAICLTGSRWRLALAGAITAAWIIGTFYYQLAFPLATKALILGGAGAALGVLAWFGWLSTTQRTGASTPAAMGGRLRQAGFSVCLVATLAVANFAIWQKEALINEGRPIFIELAPVDPRSLMQGDYMQLNFNLGKVDRIELLEGRRTMVAASIDTRGVATMQRIDNGLPLAANELRIELLTTGGGLRPATDAWYFKEGEGDRWAKARFGEFRIDDHGRALLVDLRGADLEKL